MSIDLTEGRPGLMPTGTVTEVAAAALSPTAVLTAQWREQIDRVTDLSIQLHELSERSTDGFDDTFAASHTTLEASIEAARSAMRSTEAALERLTHRTYGSCETCGRQIDPLRLIGLPAASSCRKCDREAARSEP